MVSIAEPCNNCNNAIFNYYTSNYLIINFVTDVINVMIKTTTLYINKPQKKLKK